MDMPKYDDVMKDVLENKVLPFFDRNRTNGFGGIEVVRKGLQTRYDKKLNALFSELRKAAESDLPYDKKLDGINTSCVKSLRELKTEIKARSPTENLEEQFRAAVRLIIPSFQKIFIDFVVENERKRAFGK